MSAIAPGVPRTAVIATSSQRYCSITSKVISWSLCAHFEMMDAAYRAASKARCRSRWPVGIFTVSSWSASASAKADSLGLSCRG